jgi:hypothetical protein
MAPSSVGLEITRLSREGGNGRSGRPQFFGGSGTMSAVTLMCFHLAEPVSATLQCLAGEVRRGTRVIVFGSRARGSARPDLGGERLVPGFQKISGARLMAPHLSRGRNRSRSFQGIPAKGISR